MPPSPGATPVGLVRAGLGLVRPPAPGTVGVPGMPGVPGSAPGAVSPGDVAPGVRPGLARPGLVKPGSVAPVVRPVAPNPGLVRPVPPSPGLVSPVPPRPGLARPAPPNPGLAALVPPDRPGSGGMLMPNCDRPCDSAPISSPGRSVITAACLNSWCSGGLLPEVDSYTRKYAHGLATARAATALMAVESLRRRRFGTEVSSNRTAKRTMCLSAYVFLSAPPAGRSGMKHTESMVRVGLLGLEW